MQSDPSRSSRLYANCTAATIALHFLHPTRRQQQLFIVIHRARICSLRKRIRVNCFNPVIIINIFKYLHEYFIFFRMQIAHFMCSFLRNNMTYNMTVYESPSRYFGLFFCTIEIL